MSLCPVPDPDVGIISSVLTSVDCNVRNFSQSGYLALTGQHSFFPQALTALLTIYVAVLGLRLMFGLGEARLSDSPMIALKIGLILALSLNWTTFQTLVFDLASKAPLEAAVTISAPTADAGGLARNPVRGVQNAYDRLTKAAGELGRAAGPNPQILRGGEAAAADGLWKAAAALFMATAGALSISIIAVGILLTVGPIFIALALFEATRGLFLGWARALISAALAPMVCWMTITVMLVVLQPWLDRLNPTGLTQTPDLDAATVCIALVFIFAVAQAAVVAGAAVIGAGLEFRGRARAPSASDTRASAPQDRGAQETMVLSRVERLAMQLSRAPGGGGSGGVAASGPSARAAALAQAGDGSGRGVLTGAGGQIGDVYRRDAFRDRFRRPEARNP